MAKFRIGSTAVFTIATQAVPCPTSFVLDESMDDYISDCATNAVKQHVLGAKNVTGSFSGEVEDNGVVALGYVAPGVSGALNFQPAGTTTGFITITSTKIQITGRSFNTSATGLTTFTCQFVLDDITIAAAPA